MKENIKYLIGFLKCKFFKVKKFGKKIYVGNRTKIIGGFNIKLEYDIQFRPDMLISCNKNAKMEIMSGVDVGARSRILAGKKIIIEKNVLTGPNVFISDQDHKYDKIGIPIKEQGVVIKKGDGIRIKEGSWIGTNAVIIGNIEIGKGCVIGANSVVTKNIPDYSVAVGIPAKVIKKYDFEKKEWVKL